MNTDPFRSKSVCKPLIRIGILEKDPVHYGNGYGWATLNAGRAVHDEEGAAGDQQAGPGARQGARDRGHRHRQHCL